MYGCILVGRLHYRHTSRLRIGVEFGLALVLVVRIKVRLRTIIRFKVKIRLGRVQA